MIAPLCPACGASPPAPARYCSPCGAALSPNRRMSKAEVRAEGGEVSSALPMTGVLRDGADKPCLGAREVVWSVLADMVGHIQEDPRAAPAAIEAATAILCGEDPAYAPGVPGWNGDPIARR